MLPRTPRTLTALLLSIGPWAATCEADVAVISNRTNQVIRFTVSQDPPFESELQPGELVTVTVIDRAEITFRAGATPHRANLSANSAYSFVADPDGLQLHTLSAPRGGITSRPAASRPARPETNTLVEHPTSHTIPVKILVDEEEPAVPRVWEERIRKRIKAASDILDRHCGVRLEIVASDTWESDNRIADFRDLLRDFEQKVNSNPARVAIGFTSQRFNAMECPQLGGTRGALHTHILIKEWFGRTEPERLEVLLHELGHHMGAAHSAEPDSVMRPKLGDGKAVLRKFRIGFDPLNTLVMSLVADPLRTRRLKGMQDLDAGTKERLRDVYSDIVQTLPGDPVAAEYVTRLGGTGTSRELSPMRSTPRSEATRQVVAAIVDAAERNQRRPALSTNGADSQWTGDKLAEHYFRQAAARAAQLPREHIVPAFLLGVAIALDTSDVLRHSDWTRQLWQTIESDAERKHRLEVIGQPTMQSRHDLLQHFVVSSALTVLAGPQVSEAAGIIKEMNDANGGSGFSFADLTADLAGIAFATQLQAQPTQLSLLENTFTVANHMPAVTGLREGLTKENLQADYGSPSDPRFLAERAAILKSISSLPGLKPSSHSIP